MPHSSVNFLIHCIFRGKIAKNDLLLYASYQKYSILKSIISLSSETELYIFGSKNDVMSKSFLYLNF